MLTLSLPLRSYQFNPDSFNYEVVINILTKAMLSVAYPDFNLCLSLLGEAPIPMDSTPFSGKAAAGKDEEGKEGEKKEGGKSTEAPAAASASASAAAAAAAAAEGENKVPLAGSITDPLILRLANLSQLLQTSRFREFWATLYEDDDYDDVRGYTQNVARFEEEVRKAVMDAVGTTFTRISEERLARYLHLEQGKQLDEFLQAAEQEGWKKEKDSSSGKNMVVAPANSGNEIKALVVNEDIPVERECAERSGLSH